MATHSHSQNENPGTPSDNGSQNISGVPHHGKPYITELNHHERITVEHALRSPVATVKDFDKAIEILDTAAMSVEDEPATQQQYARWARIIEMRRAGELHVIRHKACGKPTYHDGKTYGHACEQCGKPIKGLEDLSGVSLGHPNA